MRRLALGRDVYLEVALPRRRERAQLSSSNLLGDCFQRNLARRVAVIRTSVHCRARRQNSCVHAIRATSGANFGRRRVGLLEDGPARYGKDNCLGRERVGVIRYLPPLVRGLPRVLPQRGFCAFQRGPRPLPRVSSIQEDVRTRPRAKYDRRENRRV